MKIDHIHLLNSAQKNRLETYKKILDDPDKAARLKESLCQYCYYTSRIAGQAFTEYTCKLSGIKDMWPNTAVPEIHPKIAKQVGLCYECSAQIEYKNIRKIPDFTI